MLFITSDDFDWIKNGLLLFWMEKPLQKSNNLNVEVSGLAIILQIKSICSKMHRSIDRFLQEVQKRIVTQRTIPIFVYSDTSGTNLRLLKID